MVVLTAGFALAVAASGGVTVAYFATREVVEEPAVDAQVPPSDAGPPDAGPPDAGPPDAGPPDAGPPDTGPADTGPPPRRRGAWWSR